jgi:hypothetical protein
VQPIGYSPTMILLASAASVGLPGVLAISAGSVGGDWPGQAELTIVPTNGPTTYGPASWYPDMVAWSLVGRASHVGFWPAASLLTDLGGSQASLVGDFAAPGSQALLYTNTVAGPYDVFDGWTQMSFVRFNSATGPFISGRHRVFMWAHMAPSVNQVVTFSADLAYEYGGSSPQALASAQPIATFAPAIASGAPGAFGAQPSRAFTLIDLGEIGVPSAQADYTTPLRLRVWSSVPSQANVYAAGSAQVEIAGMYLLPVEGAAGILPRGLAQPTISNPMVFNPAFDLDARKGRVLSYTSNTPTSPIAELAAHYRGAMPYVGASTAKLDLIGGHRKVASGATSPLVYGSRAFAAVSVRYRPRFMFLKGL